MSQTFNTSRLFLSQAGLRHARKTWSALASAAISGVRSPTARATAVFAGVDPVRLWFDAIAGAHHFAKARAVHHGQGAWQIVPRPRIVADQHTPSCASDSMISAPGITG